MFGMGFTELLVIAVIAILFLGPDKLPSTMVEIAKFFRSMKQTVNSVKASIDEEIHLEDIKKEALEYKQKLLEAESKINATVNTQTLNEEITSLINDDTPPSVDTAVRPTYEEPTFKRKTQKEQTDTTKEINQTEKTTNEKKEEKKDV